MSLSIVLDELRATGWSGLDSTGCQFDSTGRAYPGVRRVEREFQAAGLDFQITHVGQFNCFRAEWREPGAADLAGSVVSASEAEAAVHALAQMRRTLALV